MSLILAGSQAPVFTLQSLQGEKFSLSNQLERGNGPAIVFFFKKDCPVCPVALPFLERLHRRYRQTTLWGVSQDDREATAVVAATCGLTFPILLDSDLAATVAYDLVSVPSLFVIDSRGRVLETVFGFSKADFERLNGILAEATGVACQPLFSADEDAPTLKPGCASRRPKRV